MSPKIQRETVFFKRILALLIVLAAVTVSGCLGLLWLRQKIELTAQATRLLEIEIAREERRVRYLDTKIAEIHQPHFLERQIKHLGLNLGPPMADQIVYMDGYRPFRPSIEIDKKKSTEPSETDPFRASIDLAVMESLRPTD